MKRVITALLIIISISASLGASATPSNRRTIETTGANIVSDNRFQLGLNQPELTTGEVQTTVHGGASIFRMGVAYQGLPVFFESVTVQVDERGQLARWAPTRISTGDTSPHPSTDCAAAVEWAAMEGLDLTMAAPGWLDTPFGLRPVVRLDHMPPDIAGAFSVYLDAETLIPLHQEPMVDHQNPEGAVFLENPVTTPVPEIVPLFHLDSPMDRLHGAYAHVEKCVDSEECSETAVNATPDGNGDFIYSPDLAPHTVDDAFCEVNVYNNITSINSWARDTFGWEGLFHEETWILVKVGIAWYNAAYYSGNAETAPFLIFGQDEVDMGYDADVAFHEFGHAINRSIRSHPWYVRDKYGIDVAPFGIEEGMADIWAQHHSGDPVMNSYITLSRTAANSLTCPEDLRAEGHLEARILSGLGWDIRETIGPEAWGNIIYRTLYFLDAEAGFDEFVEELARSAEDLADEGDMGVEAEHADVIREVGAIRGFTSEDCTNRIVPLPHGEARRIYMYGRSKTGGRDRPGGLQWKVTATEDTAAFRLKMRWRYPDDVDPGYRAHISRGKPVQVTWIDPNTVDEGSPEFVVHANLNVNDAPEFLEYPFMGLDPLEPGEEVYILLSPDIEDTTVVVDVKALHMSNLPPPPETDAGVLDVSTNAMSGATSCSTVTAGARERSGTLPLWISLTL